MHRKNSTLPTEACERFFSIDELVILWLHHAPVSVLINCQCVCRLWNSIIASTPRLQERLFLKPISSEFRIPNFQDEDPASDEDSSSSSEHNSPPSIDPPILNPVLSEYFAPILASRALDHSPWSSYEDLLKLPWAKDGTELDSPARQAFARKEASWRHMLVSQPPIYRLDWWHEWRTEDRTMSGYGHQYLNRPADDVGPLTLGLLWDLVEGRLRRNCEARILFYPAGLSAELDPAAIDLEKGWARNWKTRGHGYTPRIPRVKLHTRQTWSELPEVGGEFTDAVFNMRLSRWESVDTEPEGRGPMHGGDGFNLLRHDTRRDFNETRWSRSEGFRWPEIWGDFSGGGPSSDWNREPGDNENEDEQSSQDESQV